MSVQTCVGCSTQYAPGLDACPHCGSTEYEQDGAVASTRRLPLLVSVSCSACGRAPWQLRLSVVLTGLIQIPTLHCASCGSQVQIPWPPKEDAMPKITAHGGATNARETDPSPAVDASQLPLAGAEADQGERPTSVESEVVDSENAAPLDEAPSGNGGESDEAPDYDGMTLAELREAATGRDIPSYGTKAQITERLREADAS